MFYEATAPATTAIPGFVLTSNLLRDNAYGIFGSGSQPGSVSLAQYAPGAYVQGNAIGGADPKRYPVGNDYPSLAQWLADFVDRGSANYALVPSSLSKSAGADGTDIGVDFGALNAAMNGVAPVDPPPATDRAPSRALQSPFPGGSRLRTTTREATRSRITTRRLATAAAPTDPTTWISERRRMQAAPTT